MTLLANGSLSAAAPPVAVAVEKVNEAEQETLDGIRTAMAKRDLQHATQLLENAEKRGSPAYVGQLDRLDLIRHYLELFWAAVANGTRTLDALDELVVGKTRVAVVETSNGQIVLRVLGSNRRYDVDNMSSNLALTLAGRVLAEDKQNLLIVAAFHLADKAGDTAQAERLLNEAKRAGIDIGSLSQELSAARAAGADVEIPALTPTMRSLLSPQRWIVLAGEDSGARRASLTGAEQNTEGRLVIAPADRPRIIAFQTRLAANFGCRLILQCETGLEVGFYSSTASNEAVAIQVPAGTNLIELARQRGEWLCRLNGRPDEVQFVNDASPRMAGNLGLRLPGNHACTIAAFELRTR
jgi:hypothetical protein